MKSLKRIFYTNRKMIILNFIMVVAAGFFGFFLHDILIAIDSDEDQTVFPLGTMMIYFMIVAYTIFVTYQYGTVRFNMNVSAGQTRKSFIREQGLLRIALVLADQLLAFGMTQLELWKFRTFYASYPIEGAKILEVLYSAKAVFIVTLGTLSLSMLIMAVALKIGANANIVVLVLYFMALALFAKIADIMDTVGAQFLSANIYQNIYNVLALLFAVGVFVAMMMIRREKVA
jgi:hypothetical protein